jgi:antitoxin component HigA of HigAB toxin-antitoxin module
MSKLIDQLSKLESNIPSTLMEKVKYRRENRHWLRKSAVIALKVLKALKEQNLTQKDLAEKMQVSPQQISKIVKGQENLTLETIANLEIALEIKIIDVDFSHNKSVANGKNKKKSESLPINKGVVRK